MKFYNIYLHSNKSLNIKKKRKKKKEVMCVLYTIMNLVVHWGALESMIWLYIRYIFCQSKKTKIPFWYYHLFLLSIIKHP